MAGAVIGGNHSVCVCVCVYCIHMCLGDGSTGNSEPGSLDCALGGGEKMVFLNLEVL